jgi:hypothetical protein
MGWECSKRHKNVEGGEEQDLLFAMAQVLVDLVAASSNLRPDK